MSKKIYQWVLNDASNEGSVIRYCHNCGREVIFKDSQKRRRNANGKTIYEYIIYKCEKGHTWNLLTSTYKAVNSKEKSGSEEQVSEMCSLDFFSLIEHKNRGINEIEIFIKDVTGKWRIDKLLGDRIRDISRTKVCELIRQGRILLDGRAIEQDVVLKKQQTITITLDG